MSEDLVEVVFSAHAANYDAKPGDRVSVRAEDVAQLIAGGIAVPATKAGAKDAGVVPDRAASSKK